MNKQKVYPITYGYGDDIIDLSRMKLTERRKTEAYVKRKEIVLQCSCCSKRLRMTESGKIFDALDDDRKHEPDCVRNRVVHVSRKMPEDYDPVNSDIVINVEKMFGTKPEGPSPYLYKPGKQSNYAYSLPNFIKWPCVNVYNKRVKEGNFYGINSFAAEYYALLCKKNVLTKKSNFNITEQIGFRCGKLLEFYDYRENETLIWFNTYRGKMSAVVDKKAFNRAKTNFRFLFKKKLDIEDHLMYVEMEYKINHSKCIYFFPVTNNGLLCDTFLEQRIYNILEKFLSENKDLKFSKTYMNDVYKESFKLSIYDTVDCGFIEMTGVKNKKVVVEIFDVMEEEEYAELAKLKIDYVNSCSWLYLLDFYPEDGDEEIASKIERAKSWFDAQKSQIDTIRNFV